MPGEEFGIIRMYMEENTGRIADITIRPICILRMNTDKINKIRKPVAYSVTGLTFFQLSDLGSNQDSSPPKGDVLPVTPSDNLRLFLEKGAQR